MDAEVAGKIWKDYPMYALIEWVNGSFADVIIHRKHSLDRYNERLHFGLSNVYDILEEMSYSDCKRVYNFKEVDGDLRFLIANSPNGFRTVQRKPSSMTLKILMLQTYYSSVIDPLIQQADPSVVKGIVL